MDKVDQSVQKLEKPKSENINSLITEDSYLQKDNSSTDTQNRGHNSDDNSDNFDDPTIKCIVRTISSRGAKDDDAISVNKMESDIIFIEEARDAISINKAENMISQEDPTTTSINVVKKNDIIFERKYTTTLISKTIIEEKVNLTTISNPLCSDNIVNENYVNDFRNAEIDISLINRKLSPAIKECDLEEISTPVDAECNNEVSKYVEKSLLHSGILEGSDEVLMHPMVSDDITFIRHRKPRTKIIDSDVEYSSASAYFKDKEDIDDADCNIKATKSKQAFKLIDSDSDEEITYDDQNKNCVPELSLKENKSYGESKSDPLNESLYKELTPQEALQQRREIQCESQRMLRESQVALPYHKPKQRTLKEFIQKRPKFAVNINAAKSTPSVAIKMCTKQLEIISKQLEKRKKEVEIFFKSDSEESENEETKCDENVDIVENIDSCTALTISNSTDDDNIESVEEIIDDLTINDIKNSNAPATGKNTENLCGISNNVNIDGIQIDIIDHEINEFSEVQADPIRELNDSEKIQTETNELECNDLTENKEAIESKPNNKLDEIMNMMENRTPKLSGGPNLTIDLYEGVTKPDEISQLMERFVQHNSKRNYQKHKVELSIVSMTGDGGIQEEKVSLNINDSDQKAATITEMPGEKLQKLRNNLQKQIAQQRSEIWQQKHKLNNQSSDMNENAAKTLSDSEEFYENAEDDDDFNEFENNSETIADKENYYYEKDDDLNSDVDDVEVENDNEDKSKCDFNNDTNPEKVEEKKIYSKIMAMSDDSDDELESSISIPNKDDNDSTDTWEEDDSPQPGQPRKDHMTPKRAVINSKPELELLTPVYHLTALQNLNSGSKFLRESPGSPGIDLSTEPSPLKGWQKKLFSDSDLTTSKVIPECLEEGSHQNETINTLKDPIEAETNLPTTQDLINICSGTFTGMTQQKKMTTGSPTVLETQYEFLKPSVDNVTFNTNTANTDIINEVEDKLISQILDEEELKEFKKKFISPIITSSQALIPVTSVAQKITFGSDEEEDKEADDEKEDKQEDEEEDVICPKRMNRNAIVDSEEMQMYQAPMPNNIRM